MPMLEKFRKALSPESLLDVVPKEVLQSHMQGFLYGFRAGSVLVYDTGFDSDGNRVLKRLEPIEPTEDQKTHDWRGLFENFNPFCAAFRKDPRRNRLCERCDDNRASRVLDGTSRPSRYTCHMGLTDMTIPITIGGKVRGILSAGQKICSSNTRQKEHIARRVEEEAADIASQLVPLIHQTSQTGDEIDAFERGYLKFASAVQATVDAFVTLTRHDAAYQSLLVVSHQIGRSVANDKDGWLKPAQTLLAELSDLLAGSPLWLLQRRGSHYACVVEACDGPIQARANIAVAKLIELPTEKLVNSAKGDKIHSELALKLGISNSSVCLVRFDVHSGGNDAVSLILVIGANVPRALERFLTQCIQVLAHPVGISSWIDRLEKQRSEHEMTSAFVGHHLKTPIQSALHSLYSAKQKCRDESRVRYDIEKAEKQIMLGLADAIRLQDVAMQPKRDVIDVYNLVERVADDLAPSWQSRGIRIDFSEKPPRDHCKVLAVEAQLRVAFTNLIDNAIKYCFEKTRIDIHIIPLNHDARVTSSVLMIRIVIEDVGVGFPPGQKEELFSFGSRLSHSTGKHARPGSGIGLMQAKEYIEAVGGSLDIDSLLVPFSQTKYKVTVVVDLPVVKL